MGSVFIKYLINIPSLVIPCSFDPHSKNHIRQNWILLILIKFIQNWFYLYQLSILRMCESTLCLQINVQITDHENEPSSGQSSKFL